MKYCYLDLETTGRDPIKAGIIQIAALFEEDSNEIDQFCSFVQPKKNAILEPSAFEITGLDPNTISEFPSIETVFKQFKEKLDAFINPYNKEDKAFIVGYNCQKFDDPFLRQWFEDNGDKYYGSYFWSNNIDILSLASEYLKHIRHEMPNFKLKTVAKALGIKIEDDKLHGAMYDIILTKKIYWSMIGNDV